MRSGYKDIIEDAWAETLRKTVQAVIAEKVGYGLDNDLQKAIKEEAIAILKSDPELRGAIRDAMVSWVARQAAS
jgi:hypothetical protein